MEGGERIYLGWFNVPKIIKRRREGKDGKIERHRVAELTLTPLVDRISVVRNCGLIDIKARRIGRYSAKIIKINGQQDQYKQ